MQLITSLVLAGALAAGPAHGPVIPPDPWAVSAVMQDSQLNSVYCTSADNCWSVGHVTTKLVDRNQVLHWTGKKWFSVTVPNPGGTGKGDSNQLFAVRCALASDCWAVGRYSGGESSARFDQALHWNGKNWRLVDTPTPGGRLPGSMNELDDVSCTAPDNCWAVGFYGEDVAASKHEFEIGLNQVLHWNGQSWSLASVPSPAGSGKNHVSLLNSVRCASATSCWAAGSFGNVGTKLVARDQILRWNGRNWASVAVPAPAGTAPGALNELLGLSCTSESNCWAAGLYGKLTAGPAMPHSLNFLLHWNGRKWFKASVPSPGANDGKLDELAAVTCDGAKDCWAVGEAGNFNGNLPVRNTALHWNGITWSVAPTPNPAGAGTLDRSELDSVRCVTAADCWAVGVQVHDGHSSSNQILHWTGKKWFVG